MTVAAWLAGARLAPSAHNAQPWRFAPRQDGTVEVRFDPNRTLPITDASARDLWLGLGAAVEAARLAAACAGEPLAFKHADGSHSVRVVGWLTPADVEPDRGDRRLAAMLAERRTVRRPHLAETLPRRLSDALAAESASAGLQFAVETRPKIIRALAGLVATATAELYADEAAHVELWEWLRLGPTSNTLVRDGLTAASLDLSGPGLAIARAALVPARMRWLRTMGMHRLLAFDAARLVRRSASVAFLALRSTPADRAELVAAGGTLLRLWLLATEFGYAVHPLTSLLDSRRTVEPTRRLFGLDDAYPIAVFRLGRPDRPGAASPRLAADELIEDPS